MSFFLIIMWITMAYQQVLLTNLENRLILKILATATYKCRKLLMGRLPKHAHTDVVCMTIK